jgi:hypothetical protein
METRKVQVVGFGKTLVEIQRPVNAPIVKNAPWAKFRTPISP